MEAFLETPTSNFMDTPARSFTKNLSKKEIHEVFEETTTLLEQFSRDLEEQKEINNTKSSGLSSLSFLIVDYDDFKKFPLKKLSIQ